MRKNLIFPSSKEYVYILDKSRVFVNGTRVVYTQADEKSGLTHIYNIPDINTNIVILTIGCSITQQAVSYLYESGVTLIFAGNGGTPLYMANMMYRPSQYIQEYILKWPDPEYRLRASKYIQEARLNNIIKLWPLTHENILQIQNQKNRFKNANNIQELMGIEGDIVHRFIYPSASLISNYNWTKRKNGRDVYEIMDDGNMRINRANVLMYGLTASALNILGIPPSLPVTHGMQRRGGLVYDIADAYKDAVLLPICLSSKNTPDSSDFRQEIIQKIHGKLDNEAILVHMIKFIQQVVKLS